MSDGDILYDAVRRFSDSRDVFVRSVIDATCETAVVWAQVARWTWRRWITG